MISHLIEKNPANYVHLWKQPPRAVRYLKKVFTHHLPPVVKKPFSSFSNFDFDDK